MDDELYTFVTNGDARTQKGSLVAVICGVKEDVIVEVLSKIPLEIREKVKEVSVDMANNMENAADTSFPEAAIVTDRFHVAKLVHEAAQDIRIGYRWNAIDEESTEISECKKKKIKYKIHTYENGDTKKQLLARSRFLLFKSKSSWTKSQKERAQILFKEFPTIEEAYKLSMSLRNIYETTKTKKEAEKRYAKWKKKVEEKILHEEQKIEKDNKTKKETTTRTSLKIFNTVMNSIESHKDSILNFFNNRTTNALAECFNSKVKGFRAIFRGVRDIKFFLFRVSMIFS